MNPKKDILINIFVTLALVSVRILMVLFMLLIAVILAMFHAKND